MLVESLRIQDCQLSPDGQTVAVQLARPNVAENKVVSELQLLALPGFVPLQKFDKAGRARWSPDGKQLLYTQGDGLWVTTPGGEPRRITPEKLAVEGGLWAPRGDRVAYVAEVAATPRPDSGRVYDDLFLRRWNKYYSGQRKHIFVADLNGVRTDVTPGDWDAAPTSGAYSSGENMAFSPDGTALFCSAPPARGQATDTNYDVFRIDLNTLARENLTADNPAADLGPQVEPGTGRLFVLSHKRRGYESDPGQLRWRSINPSGLPLNGWTLWPRSGDVAVGEWTVRPQGLSFVRLEQGAYRAYLQPWEGQAQPLPFEGSLHNLRWVGDRWAALGASLSAPPRLLVYTGSELLTWGEGPTFTPGAVESLQVPVAGARMQMWLIKPPNYRPGVRYPLAFLIHGGPQGAWSNDWSYRWNAQVWAAQGYIVAMPNPRGSSGQGLAYQGAVSRDWGGKVVKDLITGLDTLVKRPDVDGRRVAAAGASFGGYMVNWMAVNVPRFRALVTHCGVWNLESMYGTTDELWFADWEFGGAPWSAKRPRDYDLFSPHRYAARLAKFKTPHLVIHNDLDFRCPIDQGLQLFTALQRHGVPSKFLNFPDEGHWVLKPANSLRWHQEVFDFLARYCPPNPG